jgi:hypothetical protein
VGQKGAALMTKDDDTVVTNDGPLRVESLRRELSSLFTDRAGFVFRNVRAEMSCEVFFFGRLVEESDANRFSDFATRVNRLCAAFDGTNVYPWDDEVQVAPRIEACICDPLMIPLVVTQEKPQRRHMFVAYLFVEGLPVTSWANTSSPGNYEQRRVWLNSIVGSFILASRDGELPTNSEECDGRCPKEDCGKLVATRDGKPIVEEKKKEEKKK